VRSLFKAGLEVGVVTSILGFLAKSDLIRYGFPVDKFFILQGSDDEPVHKPDPQVFDKALDLLRRKNIPASQTVYVGDALIDYYAARDAGLGFIGIATGFVTKTQFEAAGAFAVSSFTQLLHALTT
jgi:phosphoglycolate phosphatase-like HAD superfamily hydrolase